MPENTPILIPEVVTVKQLADALSQPVTAVIASLMNFGVLATINEDIDFDTAAIVADDLGFVIEKKSSKKAATTAEITANAQGDVQLRPPIVTIMGHVDHGKTTLLDTIRKTNVAGKESGGITQHISSYQIKVAPKEGGDARTITFLDTPGHSAFEAMRRHGARITDLVVLVVAADDGVKPQTVEAIKHARAMQVPIIVALNKIDKPDADPDKVKGELAEHNLTPEEWGGETVLVPVSAQTGQGIEDLLEVVLLSTDLRELKASFSTPALGVVVESHMQPGVGAVATVLIQNGVLRIGDFVALGDVSGKVRALTDYNGQKIEEATPSMPVEISGLSGVVTFGEQLVVFENEKEARESAKRHIRSQTAKRVTNLKTAGQEASTKEGEKSILNVVVKADTNGSLEAIRAGLATMRNEDVEVRVVSEGVGDISEGDISMASTSKAIVVGFNVRVPATIKSLADRQKVTVSLYSVVYELFDTIRSVLQDFMPMVDEERILAQVVILARFRNNRKNVVAGGRVEEGELAPKQQARLVRKGETLAEGKVVVVQRGKDTVTKVATGSECGFELDLGKEGLDQLAENDRLITYTTDTTRKPLVI